MLFCFESSLQLIITMSHHSSFFQDWSKKLGIHSTRCLIWKYGILQSSFVFGFIQFSPAFIIFMLETCVPGTFTMQHLHIGHPVLGPFTPTPICSAIWSNCLYTLLIKNPKLQPNPQLQMEAPNLPSQPTYRIGSRLARQIQSLHMKLWIWLKNFFIDSFCPQNIQGNRPGCINSLKFFLEGPNWYQLKKCGSYFIREVDRIWQLLDRIV